MAEREVPLIGDEGKWRVKIGAKRLDELRKRIGVVLILPAPETVFRHYYAAAELVGVVIAGSELGTLC